jgi:hypothetical protein
MYGWGAVAGERGLLNTELVACLPTCNKIKNKSYRTEFSRLGIAAGPTLAGIKNKNTVFDQLMTFQNLIAIDISYIATHLYTWTLRIATSLSDFEQDYKLILILHKRVLQKEIWRK